MLCQQTVDISAQAKWKALPLASFAGQRALSLSKASTGRLAGMWREEAGNSALENHGNCLTTESRSAGKAEPRQRKSSETGGDQKQRAGFGNFLQNPYRTVTRRA